MIGWLAAALVTSTSGAPSSDLSGMSLEDLLNTDLKVYSVSKRSEELADAAAAVYAITNEELRRIGATSVAESLRIVPGMQVARDDAGAWAVSARGFNGRFNDKMLALIDGRSAYSPLFGGVFWDRIDTLLEDVDQIEVVRGSGGTLWGTNAVNGVVSVTTRSAKDTQGTLVAAQGGDQERAYGGVRYGSRVGEFSWRVFGKFTDRSDSELADGTEAHDGWQRYMGGFRGDGRLSGGALTLIADVAHEDSRAARVDPQLDGSFQTVLGLQHTDTQDALARWSRTGQAGTFTAQAWYSREYWVGDAVGNEIRETGDAEVQYAWTRYPGNLLIAGAGARQTGTRCPPLLNQSTVIVAFTPEYEATTLLNLFAQDEVRFFGGRWRVIAGGKLERDPYTGYEVEPTLRTSLKITDRQLAWVAVSRAVAEPSRQAEEIQALAAVLPPNSEPGQPIPVYIVVQGSHALQATEMRSLEGGYRIGSERASLDLAGYYNEYRNLINTGNVIPTPFNYYGNVAVALPWVNQGDGPVWGAEASARVTVSPTLVVAAGYTWLHEDPIPSPSPSPIPATP